MGYKSYCWTMGTTSFRTKEMNRDIECQLQYLNEFWSTHNNSTELWDSNEPLQIRYYKMLKEKGFVVGDAGNPAKDARQKTSGLVEIGLIDDERRLTEAGKKILEISLAGDFKPDDNIFETPKDSYRYFLQLLKSEKDVAGKTVRPFVLFCHLMNRITPVDGEVFLTRKEFGSLMTLCVDKNTTDKIVAAINLSRKNKTPVDISAVTVSILLEMDNYKEALSELVAAKVVDEQLICKIGMNRKSSERGVAKYDKVYFPLFLALHKIAFGDRNSDSNAAVLLKAIKGCKTTAALLKEMFFDKVTITKIEKDPMLYLKKGLPIFESSTEIEFREHFFKILHLIKAIKTFSDYGDLNRRYFLLSDTVVFQDAKVKLDALPRAFVNQMAPWFEREAFAHASALDKDIPLTAIVGDLSFTKNDLVTQSLGLSSAEVESRGGVHKVIKDERHKKFSVLLAEKFPKEKVAKILGYFDDKTNDELIKTAVTDNADIPTIFEYMVAIAWYYISEEQGDVLEYMNLSLGPDMLPKTHAGGGEADIVWQYTATNAYPNHTLLIEVTTADKDSQRKLELEPVPRHLGDYILNHKGISAYCLFATNHLNPSVLSHYRQFRLGEEYVKDWESETVKNMKIIPLETKIIVLLLQDSWTYKEIYSVFDNHYASTETDARKWYKSLVKNLSDAHI